MEDGTKDENTKKCEAEYSKSYDLNIQTELDYIFDDEESETEVFSPKRSRSCPVAQTPVYKIDKETQVDLDTPAPKIRIQRNTTDRIKDTIASVSTKGAISVPKARIVTQVVCEKLYGHVYQLDAPHNHDEEPILKKPRSYEDYSMYKDVLPSSKVISSYKHMKALSQEIAAAKMMVNKTSESKLTLHYDTTSRNRIDGEWPSIILNFSSNDMDKCKMIPLRPLFFAYEDRNQIILLIVETLKRLLSALKDSNLSFDYLWRKVDAIMTDAVGKNFNTYHIIYFVKATLVCALIKIIYLHFHK